MANYSIYFESLARLNRPATAREVHDKALELFGSMVKGDRTSARQSLERYCYQGRVRKVGSSFEVIAEKMDDITRLKSELAAAKEEIEELRQGNMKLLSSLEHERATTSSLRQMVKSNMSRSPEAA